MFLRISTGFFVWDALQWARIFVFCALVFVGATCYVATKKGYGTLPSSEKNIDAGECKGHAEALCTAFIHDCAEPWASRPFAPLLGIAALAALFAVALFTR